MKVGPNKCGAFSSLGNVVGRLSLRLWGSRALVSMALVLMVAGVRAEAVEIKAKAATLYDFTNKSQIFSKNSRVKLAPANLTKLMTAVTVQQAIHAGDITPLTTFPVSEHAWRTGGAPARVTTMFARLNSAVPVRDLMYGLTVQSANDAAIVLAEGLAGSEANFAREMNKFAKSIGMQNSNFTNPTGFPDENHKTTLEDLSILAAYVIEHEPELHSMFMTDRFTWNNITQRNKNPLMREIEGLDGFGAGFSEREGFAGIGTLDSNGRRYVAAIAGSPTVQDRIQDMKILLLPSFSGLKLQQLYQKGDRVSTAQVYGGKQMTVPLEVTDVVATLINPGQKDNYKLRVVYNGPIPAPVTKGMEVGEVQVLSKNDVIYRATLVTGEDVAMGDLQGRAWDALGEFFYQLF
ncbi:D-alanyl-D-alanine carboxypeptidase DacA precursor [Pseudovibrio axinellae]|uniref:serine-type D-Ala-D-Ala carboxypeptidase n=1 Tax=Pseudovibrio axinellae TaxID=989403 RepID=A0A165XHN5_9HYPH|nr:D-alanyl-D-alanine carboxypeptidase family protein [Pseudovibrio axinellae]KZL17709.1 D-alanyl-D-alanine carboxypeptidase DacA precursor [Pseudovibrio axinellae]SER42770.1 D-alanyl-D-alanine carboxypeptidase (penicillin-binding protein 5/6) [Pseudovibrio axinellae]